MSSKYNHIAFALEILQLLAEKPRTRKELAELVEVFLLQHNKSVEDINQKIVRTIRQLRQSGFEIDSGSHSPYQLLESNFPLILSSSQRQSLYMAAHFLSDMGFSNEAGQILRLGKLNEGDRPPNINVDFAPPVDYGNAELNRILQQLEQCLIKQCRYSILYASKPGQGKLWDLDRSQLRLHNGVLYLFAYVPNFKYNPRHSVEQNVMFRIDRIKSVGGSSQVNWLYSEFPTLPIRYRMTGPLANYQPRRPHEKILERNVEQKYVEIESKEDYIFWFEQRILQYGENVRLLEPDWLANKLRTRLQKAWKAYEIANTSAEERNRVSGSEQ